MNQNMNFGKLKYREDEGGGSVVYSFSEVREREYFDYLASLLAVGYEYVTQYALGTAQVTVYKKGEDMLLSTYFPSIREARVVTEPNSAYLTFSDSPRAERVKPLMTQIDLEDFGTSVVFRLRDIRRRMRVRARCG